MAEYKGNPENASFGDWLGNFFTGNLDYHRSISQADHNNQFNALEAQKAREFSQQERLATQLYNSAEAQKSRDWQERLSNTAYQRQAADLRAAGFNPLGMLGGSGASVGTSVVAHSSAGSAPSANATGSPAYHGASVVGGTIGTLASSATNLARTAMVSKPFMKEAGKAARDIMDYIAWLI